MHTDVVQRLVSWAARIQSSRGFGVMSARVPKPPGTMTMSGRGTAESGSSATRARCLSVRFGPGSTATQRTRAPGNRDSTSYGPMASSAVMPSNSGMAMSMDLPQRGRAPVFVPPHGRHAATWRLLLRGYPPA